MRVERKGKGRRMRVEGKEERIGDDRSVKEIGERRGE